MIDSDRIYWSVETTRSAPGFPNIHEHARTFLRSMRSRGEGSQLCYAFHQVSLAFNVANFTKRPATEFDLMGAGLAAATSRCNVLNQIEAIGRRASFSSERKHRLHANS